jgi:hypothetical protein
VKPRDFKIQSLQEEKESLVKKLAAFTSGTQKLAVTGSIPIVVASLNRALNIIDNLSDPLENFISGFPQPMVSLPNRMKIESVGSDIVVSQTT